MLQYFVVWCRGSALLGKHIQCLPFAGNHSDILEWFNRFSETRTLTQKDEDHLGKIERKKLRTILGPIKINICM